MTDINWAGLLDEEDVEALWNGLFQLLSRHPAPRPPPSATDGAAFSSPREINADLEQELFLELFQKQRFEHYVNNGYSSKEIENEIAHIEGPNLVGARLRKRYPESFRMARRVSSLLKTSSRFRRFGIDDEVEPEIQPRKRGRHAKQALKVAVTHSAHMDDDADIEAAFDGEDEEPVAAKATNGRRGRMVNQIFGLKEWTR